MALAFEGIRVLDFSQVLSGPYASGQLALQGAEVIKIERPGSGEQGRAYSVEKSGSPGTRVTGLFYSVNADKRSLTLDLKRPEARAVLAEVAPQAMTDFAASEDGAPASNRFEKLINIKDRGQIFRVDVDSIERIDAAGDYMCIYTADNSLILRETMKDLERRLDPRKFQRVHRSTIVNLDQVRQVKPHTNGECFLVLDSGAEVKVSRSYRDVVARFVH